MGLHRASLEQKLTWKGAKSSTKPDAQSLAPSSLMLNLHIGHSRECGVMERMRLDALITRFCKSKLS